MSEKSGFFDAHKVSGEWDRTYISEDFARYFSAFVGNGVFANKSDKLQVIQSSPPGMSITVAPGMSWLDGYFYYNDSELQLSIDNADGSLNRIDIIVCRWSAVDRLIRTVVKKGVAAVSPQAPTPQWNSDVKELQLASIQISAGTTSITQRLITDTRPNTTVCGWVTSLINQVDTSTLFLQWQDAYNQEFTNTQNYIAQQKALWDDFFGSVNEDIGIIDGSITTSKIANQAVTTDKLANNSVTTDKLTSGAVTQDKLGNNSVTYHKLATDAVKLQFLNVSIPSSAFVSDNTYGDFPYRAKVTLAGITKSMFPQVALSVTDATSGNFAPVAESYDGGIYLYTSSPPENTTIIPTILVWRGN